MHIPRDYTDTRLYATTLEVYDPITLEAPDALHVEVRTDVFHGRATGRDLRIRDLRLGRHVMDRPALCDMLGREEVHRREAVMQEQWIGVAHGEWPDGYVPADIVESLARAVA